MKKNRALATRVIFLTMLLLVLPIMGACGDDEVAAPVASVPTAAPAATATSVPPTAVPPTKAPEATPVPRATSVPAPKHKTSDTYRLVAAIGALSHDTVKPWVGSSQNAHILPMYEHLVTAHRATGADEPRLATKWEMSPDGMSWTFNLQEGVEFHKGWGEFTAQDVIHSWERLTSEDSIVGSVKIWRSFVGTTDNLVADGDHKITFNLLKVGPDLIYRVQSKTGAFLIMSKAQWDAQGEAGFEADPAGTASYSYVDRDPTGGWLAYERVEDHWRHTPEFAQFMVQMVPEHATRLAMLLAGEAHMVTIPRDLHEQAAVEGMQPVTASTTGTPIVWFLGGCYFATPEIVDWDVPWTDVRVREAMNRAIDRETIIDNIYGGMGRPAFSHYSHPSMVGWDTEWETRGPEMYSYDPDKAKALLAEAGYADGFEFVMPLYQLSGAPELIPIGEAMAQMFAEVGINAKLKPIEFSWVRGHYKAQTAQGMTWHYNPGAARPPHIGFKSVYWSKGFNMGFTDPFIDAKLAELDEIIDLPKRDAIQREIGEFMISQYTSIPVLYVPQQAVINPDVVKSFIWSGSYLGYTDWEYMEAA